MNRLAKAFRVSCTAALFALSVLAASSAIAQVAPAVTALVSDLQGAVRLVRGGAPAPARLLADIAPGTRIELAAGMRIVLLLLASGEEVTVSGPATAQVSASGVTATPASALTRRTSGVGDTKLKRKDLTQAAIVMRKPDQTVRLPLLTLASTLTLETNPLFRWSPVEGSGPVRFVLTDDAGKVVYEVRAETTQLTIPESMRLAEGRVYSWEVSTRLANGLEFSNFGDFALAGAALRAEATRRRPPGTAAFSEKITYAVWLDSVELSDAAREAWGQLAKERPNEPELERMARP